MDRGRSMLNDTLVSDGLYFIELERLRRQALSFKKSKKEEKHYPSLIEVIGMDMRYAENIILAKFLMLNKEELFEVDPRTRVSPAAYIIKRGNPILVDSLLAQLKDDIDMGLDWYDNSALQHAVQAGREQIVLKILEMGGYPNQINKCKRSPMHRAVVMDRPDILRMLLEYGGDINIKGPYHWRPIHTVFYSRFGECLDLILSAKPLIDEPNSWHHNALSLHIHFGLERVANIAKLLENGSDPNYLTAQGYNYLHVLASNNKHEPYFVIKALELLLEHGIDINAQTTYGLQTPLHLAAEKNPKLVEPLLYYNADIALKNNIRQTPIQVALHYNESSIPKIIAQLVLKKQTWESLMTSRSDLSQIQNRYGWAMNRANNSIKILKYSKVIDFPDISYYDILTDSDDENARKLRNADFHYNVRRTMGLLDLIPDYEYHLNTKIECAFKLHERKCAIVDFLFENFHEVLNIYIIQDIIDNLDKYHIFRLHRQMLAKMANI